MRISVLALFGVLGLTACAGSTPGRLEPYECGTVERIHTLDGIFIASQPQPADFEHARDGGIKTVISLRSPDELDWDESATVEGLGLEYHSIPYTSPAELTDAVFDEVRTLLRDPARRPVLLHCSSGNRAGAVWMAYRALDDGIDLDAAEAEAKTVGLKLPAYATRAREYVAHVRSR